MRFIRNPCALGVVGPKTSGISSRQVVMSQPPPPPCRYAVTCTPPPPPIYVMGRAISVNVDVVSFVTVAVLCRTILLIYFPAIRVVREDVNTISDLRNVCMVRVWKSLLATVWCRTKLWEITSFISSYPNLNHSVLNQTVGTPFTG